MSITAAMVKTLRERTGAGMMECKKALVETDGDIEAAIDEMRKRGQAKAAKRSGKVAAEGMIAIQVSDDQKTGLMLEVNSETDFVARDENFKNFVTALVARGLAEQKGDVDSLLALPVVAKEAKTFEEARQELVAKIGENIQLRRACLIKATGIVGGYLHGDRIGVLVALDQSKPELVKDIAMHVAAANPSALDADFVPEQEIARERDIFIAQAKETGKPDNIIEKMVTGRIQKFLKETCLVSQAFIKNPDQTVADLLKTDNTQVQHFVRYEVGEGIEKQVQDFAEEVRAQVQGSE